MEKQQTNRVEDFFKTTMQNEHNSKCFDCDASSPNWASINNGVFICLNCSGVHKSLGVQVSLVRSLSLDIWTEKHMALIEQGGNQKLYEFLDQFDLNSEDIKVKYNTRAAQYFRKQLAAQANNQPFNDALPEYHEGRKLTDGKSSPSTSAYQQVADQVIYENEGGHHQQEPSDKVTNSDDVFLSPQDQLEASSEQEEWKFKVKNQASTYIHKIETQAGTYYHKARENQYVDKAGNVVSGAYNKASTFTKEQSSRLKGKLDEKGVSQAASNAASKVTTGSKLLGSYLYGKAQAAKTALNSEIDSRDSLSHARDQTKEKLGKVSTFMSTGFSNLYSKISKKDQLKNPQQYEEVQEEEELIEQPSKERQASEAQPDNSM